MSAEERLEGKHTLAELSRKSEFLRNPRYKSTVLSNTAASATLKQVTKLANEDFRSVPLLPTLLYILNMHIFTWFH